MDIIFTNVQDFFIEEYLPIPAKKITPKWYKEANSYIGNKKFPEENGSTTATIKRCMPVFDAMTAGYIIPTYIDIYVSQREQIDNEGNLKVMPWYNWGSFNPIQFHPTVQAPTHPGYNGSPFAKWMSPWSIKTPKGYSCLFIPPMHHENKYFSVLPAIVDTDTYTAPVNFPFILNDLSFEGLIPAGTPLVQIIPFKRDEWNMNFGNVEDVINSNKATFKLKSIFYDGYKNKFRQEKLYN